MYHLLYTIPTQMQNFSYLAQLTHPPVSTLNSQAGVESIQMINTSYWIMSLHQNRLRTVRDWKAPRSCTQRGPVSYRERHPGTECSLGLDHWLAGSYGDNVPPHLRSFHLPAPAGTSEASESTQTHGHPASWTQSVPSDLLPWGPWLSPLPLPWIILPSLTPRLLPQQSA